MIASNAKYSLDYRWDEKSRKSTPLRNLQRTSKQIRSKDNFYTDVRDMSQPDVIVTTNPVSSIADIRLLLNKPTKTRLTVTYINGIEIETLSDGILTSGVNSFSWDSSRMPQGLYYLWIVTDKSVSIKKIICIKESS